ncbi:MAG: tripartite tricarboxylate transporter TctB family protein [Gudongella sp.]|nr:tripartite tricarboxylate transporter TctB family protein [Gudongella sp.]
MKLSLKQGNNILGLISILGGMVIVALAFIQKLPFMRKELPGSGFFPILCGIAIAACGLLVLMENWHKSKKALEDDAVDKELKSNLINIVELRNFAYTIGISIFVIVMTPFIGMLVSTGISVVVLIRILGKESITKSIIIGFVTTLVLFLIFKVFLGMPLPSCYIGI